MRRPSSAIPSRASRPKPCRRCNSPRARGSVRPALCGGKRPFRLRSGGAPPSCRRRRGDVRPPISMASKSHAPGKATSVPSLTSVHPLLFQSAIRSNAGPTPEKSGRRLISPKSLSHTRALPSPTSKACDVHKCQCSRHVDQHLHEPAPFPTKRSATGAGHRARHSCRTILLGPHPPPQTNVNGDGRVFGCAADGERVPLPARNGRRVEEQVLTFRIVSGEHADFVEFQSDDVRGGLAFTAGATRHVNDGQQRGRLCGLPCA